MDTILESKIIALEPLHIGYGITMGNYLPTLPYIPGRVLRGMLGNYLYNTDNGKDGLFKTLRIEDDDNPMLWFKPALPDGCITIPLSIKWCKSCGKMFTKDEIDKDECRDCYHEGKKEMGLMRKESLIKKRLEKCNIEKVINTKCPIMRERHTSADKDEDKKPFNVGAIRRKKEFDFRMVLPDEYVNDVKKALVEAGIYYGVGGFRSKGYGAILFENFREEKVDKYIERRNKEINSLSGLVLNSPTIFKKDNNKIELGFGDCCKEYVKKIAEKYNLQYKFEIKKQNMKIKQYIAKTQARGWSIKDGYHLDKIYPALKEGSTAVVDIDPQLAALLEVYGIGYMNHIYGDVYFSNEVVV